MSVPPVNFPAVLVSGAVIFLLGGLWYSPALFAKRWMALVGKSDAELKAAAGSMPVSYFLAFLAGLIAALVLALILAQWVAESAMEGAVIGALCWFGFAGSTSFATALFSGKPKALWVIDSGFNLVSFVIAGVILTVWR